MSVTYHHYYHCTLAFFSLNVTYFEKTVWVKMGTILILAYARKNSCHLTLTYLMIIKIEGKNRINQYMSNFLDKCLQTILSIH